MPAKTVAGQFTGCNRIGQPICTDFGGPSFSNWNANEWSKCYSACTSSCPAANPNDNLPDDSALQACLNAGGTIKLVPGSVGYIIASGLSISQSNTELTSAAAPGHARLVADPQLNQVMLQANNLSNIQISYIEFDGNRPKRDTALCHGYRGDESNVALEGINSGSFTYNRSTQTLCGSAFQFHGSGFEIAYNLIDNNGHGLESADAHTPLPDGTMPEPWSDGITLGYCGTRVLRIVNKYIPTSVHDNWITDATDVGIVDGGGPGCVIQNNSVLQLNRHVFAGIGFGNFEKEGQGDHRGAFVKDNTVIGNDLASFGIAVGMHPWYPNLYTNGGTVTNNVVSGAVVDLMVDGANGAIVKDNHLSAAVGTPTCHSGPALFTAAHSDSALDAGWVSADYDNCRP
jgi:hypothetical protein